MRKKAGSFPIRETIVASAAAVVVALGAMALSSTPASAYHGDYERYCYYHRYDPACWRYWHPYGREDYDHYPEYHHHHHDHDNHNDHDHDNHNDHNHDNNNDHHDHDHGHGHD